MSFLPIRNFDETLGMTFITASVPFYNENGEFNGVVTGDIQLSNVQRLVNDIEVLENGRAFLLDRAVGLSQIATNRMGCGSKSGITPTRRWPRSAGK